VELFPCASKDELLRRERFYVENNECVNKKIPKQTYQEYGEKNIIELRQKATEYRENSRELINQKKSRRTFCECGENILKDTNHAI
jgi:hypothetical protein